MNFLNCLERKHYEAELRQIDRDLYTPRIFEPIEVRTRMWLSIQANSLVQCRPQSDYVQPSAVTHWELMLFNGHCALKIAEVLPELRSLAEIELYADGELYGSVPTDLVQELFEALNIKNKMTA